MVIIIITHGRGYTISHVVTVGIGGAMQLQKIVTNGNLVR
jgi:hypothetical protein